MNEAEFDRYIDEGFALIPEKFRKKIKNVAILVEDEPSAEVRAHEGLTGRQTLLGYYQGIPETARGGEYGVGATLPDTITLYRRPIIDEADATRAPNESREERIKMVIADTIWHEFAHYFGYDEEGVERRERERGVR